MKTEVFQLILAEARVRAGIVYSAVFLLAFSLAPSVDSQTKKVVRPRPKAAPVKFAKTVSEPEAFNAAWTLREPEERIAALKSYLAQFPTSANKNAALEYLTAALSESASTKMQIGDVEGGVAEFREAVETAPNPISEKLYTDTVSKIVMSLYYHGEQDDALDIAESLEPKLQSQLPLLLSLGNFYVSVENGAAAKRLALRAVEASPNSAEAYLMLAIAHRLQFELEQSAVAYSKAVDLDPASVVARRGLADMYRAMGRAADSVTQYRTILSKDETNIPARTGLVLALFDAGEKADAEKELDVALSANSSNVILLAGVAYWYATHSDPDRAVELSQRAITADPRYVWSHIALAQAYSAKNQPLDAEQALIRGRQYGRFPTLEYELAVSRAKAGMFREAVEGIRGVFKVDGDKVDALLGGRVERSDTSFADLLAPERKASIFEPSTLEDTDTVAKLKWLLAFDAELQKTDVNEAALAAATDKFVEGDDDMKVHRQVYAATALLDKKVALPKVVELTKSAVASTDKGLNAPNAAAAVMASELYESRMIALSKNEYLHVPDVPKPVLSAILRGRIEELAGWALYQEGNNTEAITRLRRAVSVLPDKSAWWRSSMWKLGAALQADGKDAEALQSYMKSYKADKPDAARYIVVEALYKKVRGTSKGLDTEIGPNPMSLVSTVAPGGSPSPAPPPTPTPEPRPTVSVSRNAAAAVPSVVPIAAPTIEEQKQTDAKAITEEAKPAVSEPVRSLAEPTLIPKVDTPVQFPLKAVSEPVVEPTATPTPLPVPSAMSSPDVTPTATPHPQDAPPQIVPEPTPSPKAKDEATPALETPVVVPSPTPTVENPVTQPSPTPQSEPPVTIPSPSPTPSLTAAVPSPTPESETPVSAPSPVPKESPTPENTVRKDDKTRPGDSRKSEERTVQPPGERNETENVPKPSSVAVLVTENIPPPITIRPPTRSRSAKPAPEKKTTALIGNGPLFEPVVITVPNRSVPETQALPAPRSCTVTVSQERISLAGASGNIGLLVGTGDPADLRTLKVSSSSPKDIAVRAEARIAGADDKAFFVIRSLTTNTGVYQVLFEAPCGKKQVVVNVR